MCSPWTCGRGSGSCPRPPTEPRRAAAALAQTQVWRDVGADDANIWGLCTGGTRPYQIVLDVGQSLTPHAAARAAKCRASTCLPCSCRMERRRGAAWETARLRNGVDTRGQPGGRPPPPTAGRQTGELVDPVAAAKRASARAERVATGLDELDQWLCDQIRGGIAGLAGQLCPLRQDGRTHG